MNPREAGFLLLTGSLGRQDRNPLTVAQLRSLADRIAFCHPVPEDRDIQPSDLIRLGYDDRMARRIVTLLEDGPALREYLRRGEALGCVPITRVSGEYPLRLRRRLGLDSPGCLWAKGNRELLTKPAIALVGSRDLNPVNASFAAEVGRQAALQGYLLLSGNARGADRTAQQACLEAGGSVISVVSDQLCRQRPTERILYLSEDGYDEEFTAQRALSRNRVIHALGQAVLVAQSRREQGGTWSGTVKNLRFRWSPVAVFADGSEAAELLCRMGASGVSGDDLRDLSRLCVWDQPLLSL